MTFREFFSSLSELEQEVYARRAGTTANYVRTHLMSKPPRKTPRRRLLLALAQESGGKVSQVEVLAHFFPQDGHAA